MQGEYSGPEVIEFLKLEVGNQYDAKAWDELSSVLNLFNREVKIRNLITRDGWRVDGSRTWDSKCWLNIISGSYKIMIFTNLRIYEILKS